MESYHTHVFRDIYTRCNICFISSLQAWQPVFQLMIASGWPLSGCWLSLFSVFVSQTFAVDTTFLLLKSVLHWFFQVEYIYDSMTLSCCLEGMACNWAVVNIPDCMVVCFAVVQGKIGWLLTYSLASLSCFTCGAPICGLGLLLIGGWEVGSCDQYLLGSDLFHRCLIWGKHTHTHRGLCQYEILTRYLIFV